MHVFNASGELPPSYTLHGGMKVTGIQTSGLTDSIDFHWKSLADGPWGRRGLEWVGAEVLKRGH